MKHTPDNPVANLAPTEQINPRTRDIDLLPTMDVLRKINAEDALVHQAVAEAIPQIAIVVDKIVDAFRRGGRLLYYGAGTSGRLGVLDASECPPTYGAPPTLVQGFIAGGDTALRTAVEGAEDSEQLGRDDVRKTQVTADDVVVGLSASGGAAYVNGAMAEAKKAGAFTAAVTCNGDSKLARSVDQPIVAAVGPEAITGSTRMKAGTAQKLVLNMLTTAAMVQIGKTYENLMVDVQPTNAKLRDRAIRIVAALGRVSPEESKHLLDETGFQVKPAVLMARLQMTRDEALAALARHHGKLRAVFEANQGHTG